VIHVQRGWDDVEGEIGPKSEKGTRKVPIAAVLRDHLDEHKLRTRRAGVALVFGRTGEQPFDPVGVQARADAAWKAKKLERITLHNGRHTYVTLMFDAGFSLERIGDYVGHSSTYMTDRYRHLLKGHEDEAREQFDGYLERSDTQARLAQLG